MQSQEFYSVNCYEFTGDLECSEYYMNSLSSTSPSCYDTVQKIIIKTYVMKKTERRLIFFELLFC